MELTVTERFTLLQLLPKEGGLTTIKTVRQIREALAFDDDIAAKRVTEDSEKGTITWKEDYSTGIALSGGQSALIVQKLEELDKAGNVTEAHLPLFEKFVD